MENGRGDRHVTRVDRFGKKKKRQKINVLSADSVKSFKRSDILDRWNERHYYFDSK